MLLSANIARSALLLASLLPAVRSAVIDVIVGGVGILKYEPEFVNAAVGDQVRFVFKQKNHTATQSTFANPCAQAPGGFHSGYFLVATDVTEGFPVAVLNVATTDPVWVYCAQGNHCQAGMVFAVNPGDRFPAFKAAATGAAAPSGSPAATPSGSDAAGPTPSATGKDHKVLVGDNGSLLFEPSNIQAQPGDTITFEFRSKNHTVTASSFDQPCLPIEQSTPGTLGFDSGYFPVAAGATSFNSYTITVNDTRPIWAYCKQGNHCGAGMVFAANAVENGPRNFTAFQDLARQINGTGANNGGAGAGGYGDGGAATSSHVSLAGAAAAAVALVFSTLVL